MLRWLLVVACLAPLAPAQDSPPVEWIDRDTGHRIVRLSREDGTQSLYFHQNAYSADGKKLIVTTRGGGISAIDLATREIQALVPGPVSVLVTGRKTGDVYYTKRTGGRGSAPATVYATNVDTGATRAVVQLPAGRTVASLNADETLLLGTYVDGPAEGGRGGNRQAGAAPVGPDGRPLTFAEAKDLNLHNTLMAVRAGSPRVLFTVSTKTGEV
jgi:oligogalacturonide lyase